MKFNELSMSFIWMDRWRYGEGAGDTNGKKKKIKKAKTKRRMY